MQIYLDFDGTVVEHQYPSIGKYNTGCFEVLEKLEKGGNKIILNTYRADCADVTLQEAIKYIESQSKISLHHIEQRKIMPSPWNWEDFRMRDLIFIDDICLGIPLKISETNGNKIVDWKAINEEFFKEGIYSKL